MMHPTDMKYKLVVWQKAKSVQAERGQNTAVNRRELNDLKLSILIRASWTFVVSNFRFHTSITSDEPWNRLMQIGPMY